MRAGDTPTVIMSIDHEIVSPELALVDPALAARARLALPEPRTSPAPASLVLPDDQGVETAVAAAAPNAAAGSLDGLDVRPGRDRRSWRLLVGVAAVTVASVLFFDVRVQVGERPASAEPPVREQAPAIITARQPAPPAVRPASKPNRPKVRPTVRRFAWAATPDASRYHVEFFRGAVRVFTADTRQPTLALPARWNHRGRNESLTAGEYRWYVWPIVSGRRGSSAVVQATLVVP